VVPTPGISGEPSCGSGSTCRMWTLARGTTAPLGSVTVPEIVPVVTWAPAVAAITISEHSAAATMVLR
jgi:hypothetical protein